MSLYSIVVRRALAWGRSSAQQQVEGGMTSTLRVLRPSNPVFDPTNNRLQPGTSTETIYEGPGSVSPSGGASPVMVGEEIQYFGTVNLAIPLDAERRPRINDIAIVVASTDPAAIGRMYRITDTTVGGLMPVSYRYTGSGIMPAANAGRP